MLRCNTLGKLFHSALLQYNQLHVCTYCTIIFLLINDIGGASLEVPGALKTSEICGFIITNHCLTLYPSILFTFIRLICIVAIFNLATIWLLKLKNYKN